MRRPYKKGITYSLKESYRNIFMYSLKDIINYGCYKTPSFLVDLTNHYKDFLREYNKMPMQTQKHWKLRYDKLFDIYNYIVQNSRTRLKYNPIKIAHEIEAIIKRDVFKNSITLTKDNYQVSYFSEKTQRFFAEYSNKHHHWFLKVKR